MNSWWSAPYHTGKLETTMARIVNQPGQPTIQIMAERCEAGLGDLVHEYVKRATMPWWKRLFSIGHKREMRSIREKLNFTILMWLE